MGIRRDITGYFGIYRRHKGYSSLRLHVSIYIYMYIYIYTCIHVRIVFFCGRCNLAVSALKIAPRRVSGDVLGISVVTTPVFAHGCTGIRKWFIDGIGMWCFAMPLR